MKFVFQLFQILCFMPKYGTNNALIGKAVRTNQNVIWLFNLDKNFHCLCNSKLFNLNGI